MDLIRQRQYAETILAGLNIATCRVDLGSGLVHVSADRVTDVRKLCKHFDWPLLVVPVK